MINDMEIRDNVINTINNTNDAENRDKNIFGANIIKSPSKVIESLKKGNLKSIFNIVKINLGLHPIAIVSGIDYKTLVKYQSDYYLYLNRADTEKLLKAINDLYIPTKLHYGLDHYNKIDFAEYEPQDAERREAKAEYRAMLKDIVKKMGEDTSEPRKRKGNKTGGRASKC
ncbi:hypothetical protein [Clostridium saudiense]|uniref:hypothetical protein n=1 Tax=Clostridium saudiense TaxID=1414720 RepID=UPI0004ACD5DD|nr:hypothetical protein [Clostridium saudiense]